MGDYLKMSTIEQSVFGDYLKGREATDMREVCYLYLSNDIMGCVRTLLEDIYAKAMTGKRHCIVPTTDDDTLSYKYGFEVSQFIRDQGYGIYEKGKYQNEYEGPLYREVPCVIVW